MENDVGRIGQSVVIKGDLSAEENLTIEGQVDAPWRAPVRIHRAQRARPRGNAAWSRQGMPRIQNILTRFPDASAGTSMPESLTNIRFFIYRGSTILHQGATNICAKGGLLRSTRPVLEYAVSRFLTPSLA